MIVSLLTINFCHLALLPLNGGIIRSSSSMMVNLHRFLSSLRKLSSLFFSWVANFPNVSLVDWDQTSNQIKSKMIILWFYFVISFRQCANKARKDANSGYLPPPPFLRTLSAPTQPYLECLLCVLLPSQHVPLVATVANVARVPLNSQRQPVRCKFATAKGRYDWPKVPASTWDVPTAKIRTLVKM